MPYSITTFQTPSPSLPWESSISVASPPAWPGAVSRLSSRPLWPRTRTLHREMGPYFSDLLGSASVYLVSLSSPLWKRTGSFPSTISLPPPRCPLPGDLRTLIRDGLLNQDRGRAGSCRGTTSAFELHTGKGLARHISREPAPCGLKVCSPMRPAIVSSSSAEPKYHGDGAPSRRVAATEILHRP